MNKDEKIKLIIYRLREMHGDERTLLSFLSAPELDILLLALRIGRVTTND